VIAPVFLDKEIARGELCLLDVKAPPLPPLNYTASWMRGPDSHIARVVADEAQQLAREDDAQRAARRCAGAGRR
jgi:hypothetical protein